MALKNPKVSSRERKKNELNFIVAKCSKGLKELVKRKSGQCLSVQPVLAPVMRTSSLSAIVIWMSVFGVMQIVEECSSGRIFS